MHRALAMADILHEIFDIMTPAKLWFLYRHPPQNDLLHSALTCRAFLSPALDAMWKRMNSILPLLKLLPGFKMGLDGRYIFTAEDISPGQWARFDYYASRVREIYYERCDDIDLSVHARLLELGRRPLLPYLRRFTWTDVNPSTFETLFSTPTLVDVSFNIDHNKHPDYDHVFEAFMETLIEDVPLLERFRCRGTLARPSLDSIVGFKNLSTLDVTASLQNEDGSKGDRSLITGNMLRAFTRMEHLQSLDINLDDIDDLESVFATSPIQFGCLEVLHVEGEFPTIVYAIERLSASTLKELDIMFEPTQGDDFRLLCRSVPFASFPCLRSFTMETLPDVFQDDSSLDFTDIFPTPLLSLRLIEEIIFPLCDAMLKMDDEDVEKLASAWPNLVDIYLSHELDRDGRVPTIRCLQSFVRHCPRLRSLGLPLNANVDTSLDLDPISSFSSHCLKDLFIVHKSAVQDVQQTAHMLNTLFPFLDTTYYGGLSGDWRQVMNSIRSLRGHDRLFCDEDYYDDEDDEEQDSDDSGPLW